MTYSEYINSPEWTATAAEAKMRANFRCQACGSSRELQVHHITYVRLGQEDPKDLAVFCRSCHELLQKHHKIGWYLGPIQYKPISFERMLELELGR